MARPNRIEYPGAFYHVYARGNNKQKIFQDKQDYTVYLDRIERYFNDYPFILYAYALMSNHIHLAIETCEIPLSKIMQRIQQSYAQYVHKKYGSVGRLFQGPHGAIIYDKEKFSLSLVRYIHRNPLEARLVENPVQYPWSSHHIYLNNADCPFLNKIDILKKFSDDEAKAMQMFNDFVLEGFQSLDHLNFEDNKDRQIIGNTVFKENVKAKTKYDLLNPASCFNGISDCRKKTLPEILKIVSKQTKVSADSILGKSRLPEITEARRVFAFISAKYGGYGTMEISRFLNKIASSVSYMIHKLENELKYNPAFQEKLWKVIHVFETRPQNED